jgi:hypothetical protein
MEQSQKMLSSILKTTQMGQIGIRSVLKAQIGPGLRSALESQLREYDALESRAHALAAQRGWELPELDPAIKFMSDMMTRMQVGTGRRDAKIAELMIKGNTRGLTKQLKNSHILRHTDQPVNDLNQKLLDSERANIRQIQGFV